MSGSPPTVCCDGGKSDEVCVAPIAVECVCVDCKASLPEDRYHSCLAHRDQVNRAHLQLHSGLSATWKVYEIEPSAETAAPIAERQPVPAATREPGCDGAPVCFGTLVWECHCPRCARESDPPEKFHACQEHQGAATDRHRRVRERAAEWHSFIAPVPPAEPSLLAQALTGRTGHGSTERGGAIYPPGPIVGEDFLKATRELHRLVYGDAGFGPSADEIIAECHALTLLLLAKNAKYGDSALNPRRVFAKSDAIEQIKVRIDDKINRIEKGDASLEDEDVVHDLLGYLILLRIATKRKAAASAKNHP